MARKLAYPKHFFPFDSFPFFFWLPRKEETPAERGARINGDGVPRTYASDYAEDHERHKHTGT